MCVCVFPGDVLFTCEPKTRHAAKLTATQKKAKQRKRTRTAGTRETKLGRGGVASGWGVAGTAKWFNNRWPRSKARQTEGEREKMAGKGNGNCSWCEDFRCEVKWKRKSFEIENKMWELSRAQSNRADTARGREIKLLPQWFINNINVNCSSAAQRTKEGKFN